MLTERFKARRHFVPQQTAGALALIRATSNLPEIHAMGDRIDAVRGSPIS